MKVEVEMLAFGKPGEIREVDILSTSDRFATVEELLECVFKYGQNDFQPQEHPSVSMGDVIRLNGKRYLILAFGFKEMTEEFYQDYLKTEQANRHFFCLSMASKGEHNALDRSSDQETEGQ